MIALLSVYDKDGLVEFAQGLRGPGVGARGEREHVGQARRGRGSRIARWREVTGSPEMLDGRVKTLHPEIHGGVLADRSKAEHLADLRGERHRGRSTSSCGTSTRSRLIPRWS